MVTDRMPGKMSNEYSWDLKRLEQTQEVLERFDIRAAKELLVKEPRRVELVRITSEVEGFFRVILKEVRLRDNTDWTQIDIGLPVIFGMESETGRLFTIDGRHRLARALELKVEWLPIITLTAEETAQIRITKSI